MTALRYIDVVLLVVAAPILLLIGVPAVGYLAGAGAWILLRAVGVAVDRYAEQIPDVARQITVRLAYALGRVLLLALAVIFVRRGAGKDDGLMALLVVVFAFTIQFGLSIATRPRRK
jgi:hypothetical protein